MTTAVFTYLDQFCCATCGVIYGLERNYSNRCSELGKGWNCPNGHSQVFVEGALQRAEKSAKRAQELLDLERRCHENTRADLTRTEHRRRAEAAAKTKLKRRAAAGVCPCCTRHFGNLQSHMSTKHPEFVAEAKKTS